MRKFLSVILLVLIVFSIFLFAGCTKNSVPNESKIQQDLNECEKIKLGVIACEYVYDDEYSIDNFEIEKRQTNEEEKEDIIFADLTIKNTYFQTELYCKITYLFYDEGGWIFENCEILEKNSVPLTGVVTELCEYKSINVESYTDTFTKNISLNFNTNLTVSSQETDCENGIDIVYLHGVGNNYTYDVKSEFCFDQQYGWIGVQKSDVSPVLLNVIYDYSKLSGTFKIPKDNRWYEKDYPGILKDNSFDENGFKINGTLTEHVEPWGKDVYINNYQFSAEYNKEKEYFYFSYKYGKYDYDYYFVGLTYDFDEDVWRKGTVVFERTE